MSARPLILDIKGNSLDDGPGIRSVVFFKGCPLDCLWCQNPESKKAGPELWYDPEKCIGCDTCIELCPESAISAGNANFVDRDKCSLCFQCADECPAGALSRAGRSMEIDEIVREIVRYKGFFDTSGGGVTLSGGEPTLFMEFASELLQALKNEGIHTLLETCGWFDGDRFDRLVLPWLDTIYMDLKIIDPVEHERCCGLANGPILENFERLNSLSREGRFRLFPRTPLIPGITDREENLRSLAEFYKRHGVLRAGLLPNNPIWMDKLAKLGMENRFADSDGIRRFYDSDRKKQIAARFLEYGIHVTFG